MDSEEKFCEAVPDLNSAMRCGILSNENGEILIIHDQPIRSRIQWIEYNPHEESFSLVHQDGAIQDLGLKFDAKMKENLKHGVEVILAHVVSGEFKRTYKTTLVIQSY